MLVPFVALVALFLAVANSGSLRLEALAFALGALCSAGAGYFGMRTATAANARTAAAAANGIDPALRVAFAGGSVMGMTVRITSYNVCYTKLLRLARPPGDEGRAQAALSYNFV